MYITGHYQQRDKASHKQQTIFSKDIVDDVLISRIYNKFLHLINTEKHHRDEKMGKGLYEIRRQPQEKFGQPSNTWKLKKIVLKNEWLPRKLKKK